MSTLAEIEAAVDSLPTEQKQELLLFLASRLRAEGRLPGPGEFPGDQISDSIARDDTDALDLKYALGYSRTPEDLSLTNALLPHLAVDTEGWE